MRLKRLALLFLVAAVTGWVGNYLGVMREMSATDMPKGTTVPLDYLVSAEFFSEVEHARAVLKALAVRYVENAQGLIVEENMRRNASSGVRKPSSELHVNRRPLAENYAVEPGSLSLRKGRLWDNKYALLGDNRSVPLSLAVHAVVSKDQILGKVIR